MTDNDNTTQPTNEELFDKIAGVQPMFTAVSDEPLDGEAVRSTNHTSFELIERVGPVYHILRHPNTRTPMAVALYGGWGTGKTTAMRWLQALLKQWDDERKLREEYRKSEVREVDIHTIWFSPWKYHKREDVWRGLIAEVILETLDIKKASVETVTHAVRLFGRFLGRSFLHAAEAVTMKCKVSGDVAGVALPAGEAEIKLSAIKNISKELDETLHPEAPYLNDFEATLKSWIEPLVKTKEGKDQKRLVIFIDDLDRCLPEVALQVLEALKLYLGMPGLLFVVGVDKDVVEQQISKHYADLGVERDKAIQYLAKMFQVEVHLHPGESRMGEFVADQMGASNVWCDPWVSVAQKSVFERVFKTLARRNPREVKRLINGAAMAGVGYILPGSEHAEQEEAFASGAQRYLLSWRFNDMNPRRWHKSPSSSSHGEARADGARAKDYILRHKREAKSEATKRIDWRDDFWGADSCERLLAQFSQVMRGQRTITDTQDREGTTEDVVAEFIDKQPNWLKPFLLDEAVRLLVTINFVPDRRSQVVTAEPLVVGGTHDPLADPFIRDAIATQVGKSADELTTADLTEVTSLDLSETGLMDVGPLASLTNLVDLSLSKTQVTDVGPLVSLTNLTRLSLSETQVTDVGPLASLTKLTTLYLFDTQVTDVRPLASLTNLATLYLSDTQVTDVGLLASLTNLTNLWLNNSQVTDVGPLASLANLKTLSLSDTQVTDVGPLASLTNLTNLWLNNSQVTDVGPLASLTNLTTLQLSNTQVTDVRPLASLTNLATLYLDNTQVTDVGPLASLTKLTTLYHSDTQVTDVGPLASLTNLTTLYLSDTQVTDVGPLASLTNLVELNLDNTQVTDVGPLASLRNLRWLHLHNTQVTDVGPLASLRNLRWLHLHNTQVTDVGPLASLTNLTTLSLSDTQVTDVGPLALLTNLTTLQLDNTQVTDVGPLGEALPNCNIFGVTSTR